MILGSWNTLFSEKNLRTPEKREQNEKEREGEKSNYSFLFSTPLKARKLLVGSKKLCKVVSGRSSKVSNDVCLSISYPFCGGWVFSSRKTGWTVDKQLIWRKVANNNFLREMKKKECVEYRLYSKLALFKMLRCKFASWLHFRSWSSFFIHA